METKRTWWGLMCMLGMLGLLGVQGLAESYGGGSGTDVDPYQIWTAEQMNTIGLNSADWSKCFILMADIDMSAYTGTQYNIVSTFTGSFEGNGHIIRNLTYTTTAETNNVGLFGFVGGQIKNLGLENVTISTAGYYAGGLAGRCYEGAIANCYTTGQVSSTNTKSPYYGYVGGLVGTISNSTIEDCHSSCQVSGKGFCVGGLIGQNTDGTIIDCYSTGDVSSSDSYGSYVGGLVGADAGGVTSAAKGAITNCYSTGAVSGRYYVGGLVGANGGGLGTTAMVTISNCYSTGAVSGYSYVGGLTGYNGKNYAYTKCPIFNCYSTGTVTGLGDDGTYFRTGGLVGSNDGIIRHSCSMSNVIATNSSCVGGLVGLNDSGDIIDCFSTGSVSGGSYVAGLVGNHFIGTIAYCYSTGAVSGTYTGGLVRTNSAYHPAVVNSFWDTETSGQTTSYGGAGKTTEEMKKITTYIASDSAGKVNNALWFDGVDDYVEVPGYYGISGSNPRTVSLWIKTPTLVQGSGNSTQGLIRWGTFVTGQDWGLYLTSSGYPVVSVYGSYIAGTTTIRNNQWHHVAATFDGSLISLYVDGALIGTCSGTSVNTGQTMPVHMGLYQYNSSTTQYEFYYKGLMDEVCIYDRALAASEIVPEDPIPTDGLVAHWSMDETQGTIIYDSVSSHNGVLHNMTAGWDFDSAWIMPLGQYPQLLTRQPGDLDGDGAVDLADFMIFSQHWLEGI